ncbi:oligosaccharide flippase family protein [Nocardioides sp. JQ2195]|nr:oligosaccharide flippase family protein [Nocardioides sp. JQ2195]
MVARFGTLAIGIALARMLGPEEFGTYAVALVALLAILSFNELGVSLAIVRWEEDPAEIAPTVTTISVGMSAVLTGAAVWAAPYFASAMGSPEAAPLVQLMSLCVLVNGVVATPAALMQRLFRQDQRMVADQVNVWLGAFVSLGMVAVGFGAISLVVGRLAGAGVSGLLFLRFSPLPFRFGFDRRFARRLLVFGLPLAGASIIVFLVGFIDQLMVGRFLGPVVLGSYVLAANLASWPVSIFSQPLRSVAPALFARMQHDPTLMRTSFVQVLRPLSAVALPVCLVMSATAPQLVAFVYGEQWSAAAPVLRWLALLAALRIFFELAYDYLVVRARTGAILRIQVVWIVVLVPALWLGIDRAGAGGAALALVLVAALVSLPMYLAEFARGGIGVRAVSNAVALPSLLAALAWMLATTLGVVMSGAVLLLLVAGTVGGICMAATLWVCRNDLEVWRAQAPAPTAGVRSPA